ncbi:MAG: hypothetical protein AAFY29_03160 [Pseudomonadota bacterium]
MNKQKFRESYEHILQQQSFAWGTKPPGGFNRGVADHVFDVCFLTTETTRSGEDSTSLSVVTAPTGAGKSRFTQAFVAAALRADPTFTAAILVQTVAQVDAVHKDLFPLLTAAERSKYAVWSMPHDHKATEETLKKYPEPDPENPRPRYTKQQMANAQIIVTTHKQWELEQESSRPAGVGVTYMPDGTMRDLLIVDETPDLTVTVAANASSVRALLEAASGSEDWGDWRSYLAEIEDRMKAISDVEKGPDFTAPEENLVSVAAARELTQHRLSELLSETRETYSLAKQEEFRETIEFIQSAARGFAFYARSGKPRTFLGYQLKFSPTPNIVIMDATADLHGVLKLMRSPTAFPPPPEVDYRNLRTVHLEMPEEWEGIRWKERQLGDAREYIDICKQIVLDNTKPGDKCLVVVAKKLKHDFQLLAPHQTWEERSVAAIHWGQGIGSNLWNDRTHVFLFGEFHMPRRVHVASSCAHMEIPAIDAGLHKLQGNAFAGPPLTVREGSFLRWHKQLACRGTVRNIDDEGRCAPMHLFAAMDMTRLFENHQRMFPGAPAPELKSYAKCQTGKEKLIAYLASSESPQLAPSTEIAEMAGVRSTHLRRTLDTRRVKAVADAYGWTYVKASVLGIPNDRRKYLVRKTYLADHVRAEAA